MGEEAWHYIYLLPSERGSRRRRYTGVEPPILDHLERTIGSGDVATGMSKWEESVEWYIECSACVIHET
jgi:hypothetical protein